MPDLNHLKVDSVPAAFADWAMKFNDVVDLIGAIEAGVGMDVKITHRPQKGLSVPGSPSKKSKLPKGRIVISARPTATGPVYGGPAGGASGNVAQGVGATGLLTDFVQPISPNTPTAYPSAMGVNAGALLLRLDGQGYTAGGSGSFSSRMTNYGFNADGGSGGGQIGVSITAGEGLYVYNLTKRLYANGALITHDMDIREIDVCVSNVAMKMLIVGSAPY